MLCAEVLYTGGTMSEYKYYHRLTRFDDLFIDGLYVNFALPSKELWNLKYSDKTMKYLEHDVMHWNKYLQANEPRPYPTDNDDKYHFVKKFLSFAKINIESSLNSINTLDRNTFPKYNNYLEPHNPKILKKPADWNESYYNGGIRIHVGTNHNLQIHFDGGFFLDKTFSKNVIQISKCITLIEYHLRTFLYNIPEWEHIKDPQFTIYQLHIAQNLYKEQYKDGFNFIPKLLASNIFQKSILKSNERQGPWVIPASLLPKHNKDIVSGYNVGITGKLKCTVYDKQLDKKHKIIHAEQRFGNSKFFRREWQIGTKKLESVNIKYLNNFLLQVKDIDFLAHVIRKIRISVDILLKNDSKIYKAFHDLNDRLPKRLKKLINNPLRFNKSSYTPMKINEIPESLLETRTYNPFKNMFGNLISINAKNMTAEQLIKLQIQITVILKNCAINGHIQSKKSNHVVAFEHDNLIKELKKFSKNFTVQVPESHPL